MARPLSPSGPGSMFGFGWRSHSLGMTRACDSRELHGSLLPVQMHHRQLHQSRLRHCCRCHTLPCAEPRRRPCRHPHTRQGAARTCWPRLVANIQCSQARGCCGRSPNPLVVAPQHLSRSASCCRSLRHCSGYHWAGLRCPRPPLRPRPWQGQFGCHWLLHGQHRRAQGSCVKRAKNVNPNSVDVVYARNCSSYRPLTPVCIPDTLHRAPPHACAAL